MSSDSTGEIYVLQRTGEAGAGKFVQPPASGGGGSGGGAGNENGNGNGNGGGNKNAAIGLWTRETMVFAWSAAAALGAWLAVF